MNYVFIRTNKILGKFTVHYCDVVCIFCYLFIFIYFYIYVLFSLFYFKSFLCFIFMYFYFLLFLIFHV